MDLAFLNLREIFFNNRKELPNSDTTLMGGHHLVSDQAAGQMTPVHTKEEQQILDEFLKSRKPFLRHRYSLRDLSEETGIAMHQLSAFLNKRRGINFNDFINQYRVQHCLEFLNHSLIKKVNLSELSSMCGFNNRNTFTTSFKKVTGQTPSEFIRKINSSEPQLMD